MKLAFDLTLMQPGCPILQDWLGGDKVLTNQFPVSKWLLEPTTHLKLYEVNAAQFLLLRNKVITNGKERSNDNTNAKN